MVKIFLYVFPKEIHAFFIKREIKFSFNMMLGPRLVYDIDQSV